jgi:hypothetical protein
VRLIPEWRKVLRYGWSVRLIVIAGFLTGLEAILPLAPELLPIPIEWLAVSQFLIVMGALFARFIAQSKESGDEQT